MDGFGMDPQKLLCRPVVVLVLAVVAAEFLIRTAITDRVAALQAMFPHPAFSLVFHLFSVQITCFFEVNFVFSGQIPSPSEESGLKI